MGRGVFGLHRREQIAFCGKFGGAKLGRLREGLARSKKTHFRKKMEKWMGRMRVWTAQARADCVSCRKRPSMA